MGSIRYRVKQTETLEARLEKRAKELREQASASNPGAKKEALLKLAREADMGARMAEWLLSTGPQSTT
ncbi:hypothetical protein J2R96_006312 [Bradyrhizobium elkanii]|uniref:Uncharacterized protein n=1 Tax=Bradyrhizobium brasilense TaxID=1419277 RepID=A0ABY8JN10_9BRAD|nr:hypothetical protein [Bradyrhizobium brasilense]MCP1913832.1 hypothetical protein [Bradyrhizobium elkanii]WFU66199.1 hypothetical protein QA636_12080 [Bradyrhizobium brasilense]